MKTKMLTKADVAKKWYLIDANGLVLGRLASQVANILRGKDKPSYTPNADTGDYVIVINADKIVLTGNKLEQKYHFTHTAYTGNYKQVQYKKLMEENSPEALRLAVKGMMPKNNLSRQMMKKLFIYKDENYVQTAQKPEKLVLKEIVK
jgi:large subunit ribosomal protein L13